MHERRSISQNPVTYGPDREARQAHGGGRVGRLPLWEKALQVIKSEKFVDALAAGLGVVLMVWLAVWFGYV